MTPDRKFAHVDKKSENIPQYRRNIFHITQIFLYLHLFILSHKVQQTTLDPRSIILLLAIACLILIQITCGRAQKIGKNQGNKIIYIIFHK
jgi:hypothetical protein